MERAAAVLAALYGCAGGDPAAPEVHVALAGVLQQSKAAIEEIEAIRPRSGLPAHARWERDKLLLKVAESARGKRLERAWQRLEALSDRGGDSGGR